MNPLTRRHALLVLAGLALTGCGGGGGSATTPVTAPVVTINGSTTVDESAGSLTVTLTRTSGPDVTIAWETGDGTATAGDYTPASGAVTLTEAAPSAVVTVVITDDLLLEGSETFSLHWTADADGAVLPGTTTVTITDDDALVALPAAGSWTATGLFHPSGDCTQCHKASNAGVSPAALREGDTAPDPAGADIAPGTDWRHTLMAHALNDPWYQAKVSAEAAAHPELAGFIEDKCLTCHAPMAHAEGHASDRLLTIDDTCTHPEGCLRLDDALADPMAREGISCTLCHRIDGRVLTEDRHSGNYPLTTAAEIFGPYTAPVTAPMVNQLGITPLHGSHMALSEHCASCHDLFTPVVDATTGEPNGNTFPEQTPYREWENSDYARGEALAAECQDCHMPAPAGYGTPVAVRGNGTVNAGWPSRTPYARHTFVGGNPHMLSVLRDFRDALGIGATTTADGFDAQIALTEAFLANAAGLDTTRIDLAGDTLSVDITVNNRSGHKLPTGFPSRRLWIALVVRDGAGNTVFASGVPDANGRLPLDNQLTGPTCTALSAPLVPCLVPHHDVIDDDDDVALYESVLQDTDGGITHTLLHAAGYAKDNRLPPRGFRDTDPRYDPATAVTGTGGDADFNADGSGTDTVHYAIDVAGSAPPWHVTATLYLQSIRPSFIASLAADTDAGHNFRVMMANVPPAPAVLDEVVTGYGP